MFLGCTAGMAALGGCIGDSPEVSLYSSRNGPVGVTVRILKMTNEESLVDDHVTVKPPGNDDYSADYDVKSGNTYTITINTDDGITGTYQWELPPMAGDRILHVGIDQDDIEFGVSQP